MDAVKKCFNDNNQHVGELTIVAIFDVTEVSSRVVRWCNECGVVVVDIDVDNRTKPGQMMFPNHLRKGE